MRQEETDQPAPLTADDCEPTRQSAPGDARELSSAVAAGTTSARSDYDGPWKDATEQFFREFLELNDPELADLVDWSVTPVFRSQELRRFGAHALRGPHHVDHLIELRLRAAPAVARLVHMELQAQTQYGDEFPERMGLYRDLIRVHYATQPIGLAVLIDDTPAWRPDEYLCEGEGCLTIWKYRVTKILDWADRREELAASSNPFAVIILAHLDALATRHDVAARYEAKWARVQALYQGPWDTITVRKLFRLVNWMLMLPEAEEQRFWEALKAYEEAQTMSYILPMERWAREEGRVEGRVEGARDEAVRRLREFVAKILTQRFATGADEWQNDLGRIDDLERLEQLELAAWRAPSLDDFRAGLSSNGAGLNGQSAAPSG